MKVKELYSNCLLAAIIAKIRNPSKTKIHMTCPEKGEIFPHFWWEYENCAYHFISNKKNRKYQVIIFKGYISKIKDLGYYKLWSHTINREFRLKNTK